MSQIITSSQSKLLNMTGQNETVDFKPNKTTEYFKNLYRFVYIVGWPNFWVTKVEVPALFIKCHGALSMILNIASWIFIITEITSLFTQKNLSEKQRSDSNLFNISHPILCSFGIILTYYREIFRDILKTLAIELKENFNDEKIERETLKKCRFYGVALLGTCSSAIATYGIDGLMQSIHTDSTFVTVVTVWPDVNHRSLLAGIVRVVNYFMWYIAMVRAFLILIVLITTIICLGQQFKQLQSYFYSLNDIFEKDEPLNVMEKNYEDALKIGIKMHSRSLWCTRQCQVTCNIMFSCHIFLNITVIIVLMSQMLNSERTPTNVISTVTTMISMLISTGFIMWNAGDLTVEASHLGTAMFHSGWQNCQTKSSVRVRKLLAISMAQAQKPVNVKAVGIINLSYDSYLSIVKSSYSVFSVLY